MHIRIFKYVSTFLSVVSISVAAGVSCRLELWHLD